LHKARKRFVMMQNEIEEQDAVDKFLEHIEEFCDSMLLERNLSSHTIDAYYKDLQSYAAWCDEQDKNPYVLTYKEVRLYLSTFSEAGYARSTINRHLSSLRRCYSWLAMSGYVQQNPFDVVRGPKLSRHLPKTIHHQQRDMLLEVYANKKNAELLSCTTEEMKRNQALLELLYATGIRVSEASNLLLKQVNREESQIKVLGKGSKERIVPVHTFAMQLLSSYIDNERNILLNAQDSPYVFINVRGNRLTEDAIRILYKKALRCAGLDESYTPHSMRHTFATDMLDGGADLRSVQELLGHESLSTTQIYTHISSQRMKDIHRQAHPRA